MSKYVVIILSCYKNLQNQIAINETYGKWLKQYDIPYFFIVGNPKLPPKTAKRVLSENTIAVSCPDDYRNLSLKMKEAFSIISSLKLDFDYLLKCDDDTFVNVDNLVMFDTQNKDYIGSELRGFKHGNGVASGGAGYMIKSKWIPHLSSLIPPQGSKMEDVYVGRAIKCLKINLTHSDKFHPNHAKRSYIIPDKYNRNITTHYVTPEKMKEFYDNIRQTR